MLLRHSRASRRSSFTTHFRRAAAGPLLVVILSAWGPGPAGPATAAGAPVAARPAAETGPQGAPTTLATFFGVYRALVVENADPLGLMRLRVQVPAVFGGASAWAAACVPAGATAIPAVGDPVWVMFEAGNSDAPVWIGTMVVEPRTGVGPQSPAPELGLRAIPNPTRGTIEFGFQATAGAAPRLEIFDVQGRVLGTLGPQGTEAGMRRMTWDARTGAGAPVEAGVYYARLTVGGVSEAVRFVVTR